VNNIAVNIFYWYPEKKQVLPKRKTQLLPPSQQNTTRREANLLMFGNKNNTVFHYVGITDMSRLLRRQRDSTHDGKTYPCTYCFKVYTRKEAYERHLPNCTSHEAVAVEMPEKGSVLKFKNTFNQIKGSGIIYADFESFNLRMDGCRPGKKSFTEKVSKQTANSYNLIGVCSNGKRFCKTHNINIGEESPELMKQFYHDLAEMEVKMRTEFQSKRKTSDMIISKEQRASHTKAKTCFYCSRDFKTKLSECVLTDEQILQIFKDLKEKKKMTETQSTIELVNIRKVWLENAKKVRDHNHCTGEYIAPACSECNRKRHDRYYKIPVVFHNLQGYDGRMIVKEAVEMCKQLKESQEKQFQPILDDIDKQIEKIEQQIDAVDERLDGLPPDHRYLLQPTKEDYQAQKALLTLKKITMNKNKAKTPKLDVIPLNTEKYLSFTCGGLRFIDSLSFMSESLDKLAENLPDAKKLITKDHFKNVKGDLKLLLRKGVYCYSWMDDAAKFDQTHLPTKAEFYNDLNEKECSDEDYDRAKQLWNEFDCKTFRDFHNLSLESDVTLLADVFETFREMMLKTHALDPAHYFSVPQMSWDAMMKLTEVELELLSDHEMHLLVESGIYGGISFISHRHSKANNKYMKEHDKSKPTKHLLYVDENNQYGKSMMLPLPYKDFEWLDEGEIPVSENDDDNMRMIKELTACSNIEEDHQGYILEVDMDYPDELHDKHNSYPLLPERIEIQGEQYSDYQKSCLEKTESDVCVSTKLIPTLRDKKKYVLDIRFLKCAMEHGLILRKIHRGIKFTQRAWMKPYIELNSRLRAKAENDFEKDFYKLLNNSCYGKSMENIRNRINFEIVTNQTRMEKVARDPRLKLPVTQFGEECCGVQFQKEKIKLCKPIYSGLSILNLAKIGMYDFHYNQMIGKYGEDKVKLLFTDTDSFCYEVETEDIYADMATAKEFKVNGKSIFDTSNYPKDHPLYSLANKKVPGCFKDECGGVPMVEFIGLRSKMYSYTTMDDAIQGCTHKGIARKVNITHEEYRKCLVEQQTIYKEWNCIRGKNLELFVVNVKKKALSPMDDKTYLMDDGISSLKWGHWGIPHEKNIAGSSNNT